MGKFINQEYTDAVSGTIEGFQERLKNPFYTFIEEKPYVVTYFNINIEKSSFDEATGFNYSSIGPNSSIKYNKIIDFVIYGIEHIEVTINTQEIGTEAEPIGGNATILPNTIIPYAGDYILFNTTKEQIIFRVTDAQSDTLDNGANIWKIEYMLEHNDVSVIEECIVDTYKYIPSNVGTGFSPVLKDTVYNLAEKLDDALSKLREFYKTIFYSNRVQSLIFLDKNRRFYDSYVTEFVIRNKILQSGSRDYLYLDHQIKVPKTFPLDYDRSFFRKVELKTKKGLEKVPMSAYAIPIEGRYNIFYNRAEEYCELIHETLFGMGVDMGMFLTFQIFDHDLIAGIMDNKLCDDSLSNIIIKYFNDIDLNENDIEALDDIDYKDNCELFFKLPIIIFVIEYYIKKLMSK